MPTRPACRPAPPPGVGPVRARRLRHSRPRRRPSPWPRPSFTQDILALYREGDTYVQYHREVNRNEHVRVSPWVGGRRRVAFVVPLSAPALLTRALGTDKVKIRDFHVLEADACPAGKGLSRLVMLSTPMLWMPGPGHDLHIATVRFVCVRGGGGEGCGGAGDDAPRPHVTLSATITATADALKWLIGGLRSAVEGLLLRQCEGMARSFVDFTARRAAAAAAAARSGGSVLPAALPPLPPIALPPPLRPLAGRDISLPATPAAALELQRKAGGGGGTQAGAAALARLLGEGEGGRPSSAAAAFAPGVLAGSSSGVSDGDYHDAEEEEEYAPAGPLAGTEREERWGGRDKKPDPQRPRHPRPRPSARAPYTSPKNPLKPPLPVSPASCALPVSRSRSLAAPLCPYPPPPSPFPPPFLLSPVLPLPHPSSSIRLRRVHRPDHVHGGRHAAPPAPTAHERGPAANGGGDGGRDGGGHAARFVGGGHARGGSGSGSGGGGDHHPGRRRGEQGPPPHQDSRHRSGRRHPGAQSRRRRRARARARAWDRHPLSRDADQVCGEWPGRWRRDSPGRRHAGWGRHDRGQSAGGRRAPPGSPAGELFSFLLSILLSILATPFCFQP